MTLAALAAGCGGGDRILLPGDGVPTHLEILSGDGQSGRVGEPLPKPVVVQVTDSKGRAVEGVDVNFAWISAGPGADVVPGTATTDADGEADAQVVLGTRVGAQTGEARVVMGEGDPPKVSFTATALSENANGMAAVSGDEQRAPAGSTLPDPLVVEVTDAFGNPIPGIEISWTAEGGGSVSQASVTTDEAGRASVERTLGPTAGPQSTVASAENLAGSPVTFSHTATAGDASGLSIVSGNDQTAAAGTRLPADLVVRLVDAGGNGVPSAAVTWLVGAGDGTVTPEDGITDEAGRSSARWTLGTDPGDNRVDAVVSGVGIVTFRATGTLATPAALSIQTQPSSSAQNGEPLQRQPVIQLQDVQGHDAARGGVVITAQLNGGGGALIGTRQRTTDPNGRATFTDLAIVGADGSRRLAFTASGFAGAISNEIAMRPAPTITTITSDSPDPSTAGTSFTVLVRVGSNGVTPTGSVAVTVSGNGPGCTITLAGGSGSCPLTLNVVGDRTLTATYLGAPGLERSSGTAAHRVNPATSQNRPPVADFNWDCPSLECRFRDNSTDPDGNGTIASWRWDFGDPASGVNNTSGERNPSHQYSGSGPYTVTLTVTDNAGASSTASTSSVRPKAPENKAPHAEFGVSCPNQDLTCTFADNSRDDDGSVTGWRWDFGDGQIFQGQNPPPHLYSTGQTYHVTLTVTDNGGATDSKTHDAKPKAPPSNTAPTAANDNASAKEDVAVSIDVLANDDDADHDPLTPHITQTPTNGTAVVNPSGSITYTPNTNFFGTDNFKYQVTDGREGTSNEATVSITITSVNDAPVAQDDSYSTTTGVSFHIPGDAGPSLLANDSDVDGDELFTEASTVATASGGSVTIGTDGSFDYTPPSAPFTGSDTFTYTVTDRDSSSPPGLSDTGTVSITIN
jgi:large repetitive protein